MVESFLGKLCPALFVLLLLAHEKKIVLAKKA
jgi:hypothetical protein